VQIVWDTQWLTDLEKKIISSKEIVLDTETSSLNIIEAELIWVSIYIDDKNIFYINRLHHWAHASDKALKDFLNTVLKMNIVIVWHNLKYDLEIIELFLKSESQKGTTEWTTQMSFWI